MIIKELKIKAFGALKDKELQLKDGINIIYGENERGKSTLQTFIKVMLYGFSASRSKDIKSNDRLKYTPWTGDRPGGELYLSHNGKEIIIQRNFGSTKKEDNTSVLDGLTGKSMEEYKSYSPGEYFLELKGDAFEKTLSIKQLNTYIASSKDDDLLQRISNLRSSGEENISIHKAIEDLQFEKKLITNNRKGGSLDIAEKKLSRLYDEYHRSLKLSEENIDSKQKLNILLEKREELKKELMDLELYKKYYKKSKLHKEYKEIVEYLKKSESLEAEKLEREEELHTEAGMVDELFLTSLEEELSSCDRAREAILEKQQELSEKKDSYEEKEKILQETFRGYIDDDYEEEEILSLITSYKNQEFKIREQEDLQRELSVLKSELASYEEAYEPFINSTGAFEESKQLLSSYEEKLIELKEALEEESGREPIDRNIGKIAVASLMVFLGLILAICGFLFKGNGGIKALLISTGVIAALGGAYLLNKAYNLWKENKIFKSKRLRQEELKKTIDTMEDRLIQLMEKYGYTKLEDFLKGIKRYSLLVKNVELLKFKIQDREEKLYSAEYTNVRKTFEAMKDTLQNLLINTGAEDIDDLLIRLKEFKSISLEVKLLKRDILSLEKDSERLWNSYRSKEEQLKRRVEPLGLKDIPLERLIIEIGRLKERHKKLKELEAELKAINTTYSALLKERDIESIKEEVFNLDLEAHEDIYSNEEEIEDRIKALNIAYLNNEKEIKDTENLLDNLFKGISPLWIIEEEIELEREEIAQLNKRLRILDIAIYNLQESYVQVQNSYGPIINQKVGELMADMTGDKYKDVKVSEEYSLTLRDGEKNTLFNGDYLSSGTFDQAYLALRIAMIMLLFPDKEVPIILDDAFVQYDDERLKNTLKVLKKIASNKQIIIFTCQKREAELLSSRDFNYISL